MSQDRSLEVSVHNGKPLIAYLYLAPRPAKSARCLQREPGLVIDVAADGTVLGVEIIYPSIATLDDVNSALAEFGLSLATREEFRALWP